MLRPLVLASPQRPRLPSYCPPNALRVRSANLEKDVTAQLDALQSCNRTLYQRPDLLATLAPAEMLTYFGKCWRGTWRDHVTNILPFVCVRAWLAAGFQASQFMIMRSEKLRGSRSLAIESPALAPTRPHTVCVPRMAQFTTRPCSARSPTSRASTTTGQCCTIRRRSCACTASRPTSASISGAPGCSRRIASSCERRPEHHAWRRMPPTVHPRVHQRHRSLLTGRGSLPFLGRSNSHSQYTGHDAVRRTQLSPPVQAELDRLIEAHAKLLDGIGIHEL